MKKIFLVLSLSFFGIISAQTEKGSFIISGQTNLGFTSNNVKFKSNGQSFDGPTTNTFNIAPGAGYFIADNLALGLTIDYKSSTTKQKNSNIIYDPYEVGGYSSNYKQTETTISAIPNATYYFSEGKLRPYLNAGIGYGYHKYKSNVNGSADDNGFIWTTNGGLLVLITQNIGMDFGLGYANYAYKNDGVTVSSGAFGAVVGINIFL